MTDFTNDFSPRSHTGSSQDASPSLVLSAASASPECFQEIEAHSVKHLESPSAQRELASILEELNKELSFVLDKCGFYYRLNSRVKSVPSLTKKLSATDDTGSFKYHSGHLLQDLFGFRILIYFIEDMPILKNLLRRHFTPDGEWTRVSFQPQEFNAISINGVFRLSDSLKKRLSSLIRGKYIDSTFEIQLRTVSFDGWHEIEHDYGYKFNNMWQNQGEYLRRFHSILATLELCDDTTVTTLENLAYDIYARKRHPARYTDVPENFGEIRFFDSKRSTLCDWDRMIRAHFRLRINHVVNSAWPDQELLKPLSNLFECEAITDGGDAYRFAKYVLRFRKETLVNLLYDPAGTLNATRAAAQQEFRSGGSAHRIWDSYQFKDRISIDVNSIVVLILLYKDARESSLSDAQRLLLTQDNIKKLVSENSSSDSMLTILHEKSTLLSLPENSGLRKGWNTIHQNRLMLTTCYTEQEWKRAFVNIILSDIKTLLPDTVSIPDQDTLLTALDGTGKYESISIPGTSDRFFRFCVRFENDGILYAVTYPGLYNEDNYWRQIAEFTPMPATTVFDGKGIPVKLKLCLQYRYAASSDGIFLPEVTEPNLLQVIRSCTQNRSYSVKPYIGQKSDLKRGRHYMDITYIKRVRNSDPGAVLEISEHFLSAICARSNIHPVVLFLFDSPEELARLETRLAIFENSLGNIAYIYAGIISDADSPVFTQYYETQRQPEPFMPLVSSDIDGCGVYVFRQPVAGEGSCAFIKCTAARSLEDMEQFQYTVTPHGGSGKPETHHGIYALTECLRHELRKYNLLVENDEMRTLAARLEKVFDKGDVSA